MRVAFAVVLAACGASAAGPPHAPPCFPGAYYRKLVSTYDAWTRIEATVTLPTPIFDPARRGANGKLLDNTSVYVGGRSEGGEIDCGLSWEVIREPDGTVSSERTAFRPFWRNKQWHTAPAEPALYFAPGDVVRLVLETRHDDQLTLGVLRGGADGFHQVFTVDFDAPGFGPGRRQELKAVSAIDQAGNEGKPVQPTQTRVTGLVEQLALTGTAATPNTWTEMRCPSERDFAVEALPDGRQHVDISPHK